jgi:hypothetical protein
MESSKVPQQNISTYANNKKAIYATGGDGKYTRVASSGWEVEEAATKLALAEFERQAALARKEVAAGRAAPLYYHMYARRMDLQTLAQATGFFKWRIKRHFKPSVFASLRPVLLARYAEALGISRQALCSLPAENEHG